MRVDVDRSEGLRAASVRYQAPLNSRDVMLDVFGKSSRSEVIEAPFDKLDIESKSDSYALALRYPLTHTPALSTALSMSAEYRRSESFLLGVPFAFDLGTEKGVSKVAVIRLGYEWSKRSQAQAAAVLQYTLASVTTWRSGVPKVDRACAMSVSDGGVFSENSCHAANARCC